MVWLVYVCGVLIFGSSWVAMKIGLQAMPPFTAAVARSVLAFVLFFLVFRLWRFRFPRSKTSGVISFSRPSYSMGLVLPCFTGGKNGSTLRCPRFYATMPLFTGVLAHYMIPSERFTMRVVVGLLIGIVGTVVLFAGNLSLSGTISGMLATAASSACCAWATVKTKRDLKEIKPVALAILQIPIGLIILMPAMLACETPIRWFVDAQGAGSVIYLAIFGTGIGFIIWFYLLKHLSAVAASMMTLLEPVVASLLSYLILSESFDNYFFAGSALVLIGVAIATTRRSTPAA